MSGVKRKMFSVSEKVCLIRDLESGSTNSAVSRKYGLSTSTVSTIWKNREIILAAFENNQSNCKKLKKCDKSDLDEALLTWFKIQRSGGLPMSGPILKAQAEKLAVELGYHGFKCNNGWIDRFKNRNNIVYVKDSGEALSIGLTVVSDWTKNVWPRMKRGYSDSEIYNADETGVFYNVTPDKTVKLKTENCASGKHVKHRLTVLVCANMSGSDKRKLVVIGKSAKPTSFKNVRSLPVTYSANRKAWMTSEIFQNELRKWDEVLHRENKKILLLIDSCSAHPELHNLTNIKLCFLPPNLPSTLQPMDQGVIRSFKYHFRRLFVLQLISLREKFPENTCDIKISVLEAIRLLSDAWNSVTSSTIRNCFKNSGLAQQNLEKDDIEDGLPLSEWLKVRNISQFESCTEIDEFVNIDNYVVTCGIPTDAEILSKLSNEMEENENSNSDDGSTTSDVTDARMGKFDLTWEEVEKSLEMLTKFCESHTTCSDKTFKLLSALRNSFRTMKYIRKDHETKVEGCFKGN